MLDHLTRLAAVQDVRCVNCDEVGWIEIVAAVSGLVGVIAAVIALIVALSSAKEAKRSAAAAVKTAEAAERTAAAAEEEAVLTREQVESARAEAQRRPRIAVDLEMVTRDNSTYLDQFAIRIGLRNVGDRVADRVMLNLVVPQSVGLSFGGQSPGFVSHNDLGPVDVINLGRGRAEPGIRWAGIVGPLDPVPANLYNVQHLDLRFPSDAEVPVLITVSHDGLRGDVHHFFVAKPEGFGVAVRRVR